MRRAILPLTILYFFVCGGQGIAAPLMTHYYYEPNGLLTATGIIQAMGLNSIEIYDEYQKRVERFVYFDHGEGFHKGEYVRIFYHPHSAIVVIIKRMKVLEYKNGQNLGNIFRDNRRN